MMVITRTPLRISFAGGGTDLPEYFKNSKEAGRVFSTTIDKYVYIMLNQKFDNKIRVSYSKTETVTHASDLEHDIIREIFRYFGLDSGWEIVTVADIPGVGSGLGSSSALAVGLIYAIMKNAGVIYSYYKIAEIAYEIEREKCDHYCGKQDQYACALGGMNEFGFFGLGQVFVRPMINASSKKKLNENLLLFYIGPRKDKNILKRQNDSMDEGKMKAMDCMAGLAVDAMLDMARGNYQTMGQIMDINWECEKGYWKEEI